MSVQPVLIDDIRQAVTVNGLAGKPVCIHSSLKSFGRVAGGPRTVIDAFLLEGCTVIVPAFVSTFWAMPSKTKRYKRNAWNYDALINSWRCDKVYTPETNDIDEVFMGAIPAELLRIDGRSRGRHPMNSFAAVGPLAESIISHQTCTDVYGHFRALADADGMIVLMGVDLNRMTFIHYAEQCAGRNLFIRWANTEDEMGAEICVGSCSEGFVNLDPILDPYRQEAIVGASRWSIFSSSTILPVLVDAIRQNPQITHCADPACTRCNDMIAGGPIPET
jgi:aminoglycoside N3'-acetyltransferase